MNRRQFIQIVGAAGAGGALGVLAGTRLAGAPEHVDPLSWTPEPGGIDPAWLQPLTPYEEQLSAHISLAASHRRFIAGQGYTMGFMLEAPAGFSAGDRVEFALPQLMQYRPWSPPQTQNPLCEGYTRLFINGGDASDNGPGAWIIKSSDHGALRVKYRFARPVPAPASFWILYGAPLRLEGLARAQEIPVTPHTVRAKPFRLALYQGKDLVEKGDFFPQVDPGPPHTIEARAIKNHSNYEITCLAKDRSGNPVQAVRRPASLDAIPEKGWDNAASQVQLSRGKTFPSRIQVLHRPTNLACVSDPLPTKMEGYQVLYGDLHTHCGSVSGDALHDFDHTFAYARDTAGLDFMALTDHAEYYDPRTWHECLEKTEQYHNAGSFITFPGFEWTKKASYGHRTVIFKNTPTKHPIPSKAVSGNPLLAHTPEELWKLLDGSQALTTPHNPRPTVGQLKDLLFKHHYPGHRGLGKVKMNFLFNKMISPTHHQADWSWKNNRFQRLVEITSRWSEYRLINPGAPIEALLEDIEMRTNGVRDALLQGHRLGFIGSSDNHSGRPGHGGVAGVLARDKTREAIWEALEARRTFAATCRGIRLVFTVNGNLMGAEIPTPERVEIRLDASGTDTITQVEVFKMTGGAFETLHRESPLSEDFTMEWEDLDPGKSPVYYARIVQTDGHKGWSSPVYCLG